MEEQYKEVYYGTYCKQCKYYDTDSGDDPCDECLATPMNTYSHKPINWEGKT